MAGHGGGAWKVAYADFVTAMMAFFLVMWIVGQSDQVKEAIRQTLLQNKRNAASQKWEQKMVKHYCGTIGYQSGYAPAPGQDPCKRQSTTGSTTG